MMVLVPIVSAALTVAAVLLAARTWRATHDPVDTIVVLVIGVIVASAVSGALSLAAVTSRRRMR